MFVVWLLIALSLGFLVYLAVPVLAMTAPVTIRERVGKFYLKLAARSLGQFSFVRRVLSGYDVKPITVDDEQKLLKNTLSSNTMGDDEEYRFKDPDNRIKRLFNKPVAMNYELIPAAIDAELAEIGDATQEKQYNEGLQSGNPEDGKDAVTVDPYVQVPSDLQLIDPIDAFALVPNSVNPENVKTAEQITKKRFEKYGSRIDAMQLMSGVTGFLLGIGGAIGAAYVRENLLDGGGGGGISNPVGSFPIGSIQPPVDMIDVPLAMANLPLDMVVHLL